MNNTQKEIARAADKITEAMNIIDRIAEANGMHISFEKEKDPFTQSLAEAVADITGKDFDCVYEILIVAFDLIEEAEDDN